MESSGSPVGRKAGVISGIRLENFMCHSSLQIEFGDWVNFITGQNGSKSYPPATLLFSVVLIIISCIILALRHIFFSCSEYKRWKERYLDGAVRGVWMPGQGYSEGVQCKGFYKDWLQVARCVWSLIHVNLLSRRIVDNLCPIVTRFVLFSLITYYLLKFG